MTLTQHTIKSFYIIFSMVSLNYYKNQNYKDVLNPGILGKKALELKNSE